MLLAASVSTKMTLSKVFAFGVSLAKGRRCKRRGRKHHHLPLLVHLGAGALLNASEAGALVHHPLLPAITLPSRYMYEIITFLANCGLLQPLKPMAQLEPGPLDHLH